MDLVVDLQKARLMAFLRRFGSIAIREENPDAMMLVGFAVGLVMAAEQPEAAANLLVELAPPPMQESLAWVAWGSPVSDPDEPIN